MASMKGCNEDAEKLTAEECERRALAALEKAGDLGLSAANVGYMIWPDRRFDARGAGLAAVRVLRRLEDSGKVYWAWTDYNRRWYRKQGASGATRKDAG